MSVMFHELSHDILNAVHDDSHKFNLMHSTNLPENTTQITNQMAVLLSEYLPNEVTKRYRFLNKKTAAVEIIN